MENLTEIKLRLIQFAKAKGFTREEFYKKTGINGANFRGKNASSELGSDKIVSILHVFPELNPDWLLLGNGEMLRSSAPNNSSDMGIAIKIISEKDARIESLIRENERLLSRISFLEEKAGLSLATTKEAVLSE